VLEKDQGEKRVRPSLDQVRACAHHGHVEYEVRSGPAGK
jgi:hypothetical protein